MPQLCRVCSSSVARSVDRALLSGGSPARIAEEFGFSKAAVQRHFANHLAKKVSPELLPTPVVKDRGLPRKEAVRAEVALAELERWEPKQYFHRQLSRVERIAEQAEAESSHGVLLNAVESSRRLYGDAIHLFAEVQPDSRGDDRHVLHHLHEITQSHAERELLGKLLLRLDGEGPKGDQPEAVPREQS